MYYSFVMMKPDAVRRELVEQITLRLREKGLGIALVGCRKATAELIQAHYAEPIQKYGPAFQRKAEAYFQGQTVLPMLVESSRADVVAYVREIVGATDPMKAAAGTIRGDFGEDSLERSMAENRICENLIHASDSDRAVREEAAVWFGRETLDAILGDTVAAGAR